jgi:hypothetical protein
MGRRQQTFDNSIEGVGERSFRKASTSAGRVAAQSDRSRPVAAESQVLLEAGQSLAFERVHDEGINFIAAPFSFWFGNRQANRFDKRPELASCSVTGLPGSRMQNAFRFGQRLMRRKAIDPGGNGCYLISTKLAARKASLVPFDG